MTRYPPFHVSFVRTVPTKIRPSGLRLTPSIEAAPSSKIVLRPEAGAERLTSQAAPLASTASAVDLLAAIEATLDSRGTMMGVFVNEGRSGQSLKWPGPEEVTNQRESGVNACTPRSSVTEVGSP